MPSKPLALAIPTYNRPSVLMENLRHMLPELKAHQVPVYISDDSDNEDTRHLIELLKLEYDLIHYRRNTPSLGHDQNCISTLAWPEADYIWYMGDSIFFKAGSLGNILKALETQPEFVFLNSYVKDDIYHTGIIRNWKQFLMDTTWYLTLTGATIYSSRSLGTIKNKEFDAQKYPNFVQLAVVFEYFSRCSGNIYWFNETTIDVNKNKKSYWLKNAIKVFVVDWSNFIESILIFNETEKSKIIRSHSAKTHLFGIVNLLLIRKYEGISFRLWVNYRKKIKKAFHLPSWIGLVVSLVPVQLVSLLLAFGKSTRKMWNRDTKQI
ncbi:glycosyltransferase family 2 protein [Geothrix sp. SG200]|uniref:glycosyltransferase family 2 protein n=1 Tax=Geothrix sp. SG200 TaxID=2922865 RepID=UPI001FAD191F|nr:glycosyltransferase family 2 protein [Geothrix sp. SG200]